MRDETGKMCRRSFFADHVHKQGIGVATRELGMWARCKRTPGVRKQCANH